LLERWHLGSAGRAPAGPKIYYFLGGLVTLFIILIRKQTNGHQSGFSFLLFVSLTSGFRLFFSGFQETASLVGGGLRIPQLIFWTILAISLSLLNKHKLPLQMVKPYESQG